MNVENCMFVQLLIGTSGWTSFNSTAEETIDNYDSIQMTWTPLTGQRPPTTFPTDVLLGELTVGLPTLLIVGWSF